MRYTHFLVSAVMLLLSSVAIAATSDYMINVTVKVMIVAQPCKINNDQTIDVDFGNSVITTEVSSGKYEVPINYTLDCSAAEPSKALKMRISGQTATFDNRALQTSVPELGIAIKANGETFAVGSDFNFTSADGKPTLTALLVQQPGSQLPTGEFSSIATMTVDYQ